MLFVPTQNVGQRRFIRRTGFDREQRPAFEDASRNCLSVFRLPLWSRLCWSLINLSTSLFIKLRDRDGFGPNHCPKSQVATAFDCMCHICIAVLHQRCCKRSEMHNQRVVLQAFVCYAILRKNLPASVFSLSGFIASSEKTAGLCRIQALGNPWRPTPDLKSSKSSGTSRHNQGVGMMAQVIQSDRER